MISMCLPKDDATRAGLIRISSAQEIETSYRAYLMDESHFGSGHSNEIFFPSTEAQICQILKDMSNKFIPVTVSGSRTGIAGGAVPLGGVVINLERMNHVLDLIHEAGKGWSLWSEPGLRLADLHMQVESKKIPLSKNRLAAYLTDPYSYFYPPNPTEETALIGSTVATNASGGRSFHYGTTRDFVQSLRVALTNGKVLELERGKCPISADGMFHIMDTNGKQIAFAPPTYTTPGGKSTCGLFSRPDMELIDLFIGSEGTLGVITAARLKLVKKPGPILSGLSFFPKETLAISFVSEARLHLMPLSLEYFDSYSLDLIRSYSDISLPPEKAKAAIFWETAYQEEELEEVYENWETTLLAHGSSMEDTWAGMEKGEREKLKKFRHGVPEFINGIIAKRKAKEPGIHKVSTDMAVPDKYLVNMMDEYQYILKRSRLEYLIFGHIGDNHLHVNILPKDEAELSRAKRIVMNLAQKALSLGGVVAAEHGIGKLKHELLRLQYGDKGLKEMARIKKALDPNLILGRGNIIPEAFL